MAFHLYIADDFDSLANRLDELLKKQDVSIERALEPDTVIMQSGAMAERLMMYLADRRGIATAIDMPFPRRFITAIIDSAGFNDEQGEIMGRDSLLWSTMDLLEGDISIRESIGELLPNEPKKHALFSAAGIISSALDDYSIMRPSLLDNWEGEHYQKAVYEKLLERGLVPLHTLSHYLERAEDLPERIFLFGVFYLPPVIWQMLHLLSQRTEIHYLFLKPSGFTQPTEGLFSSAGFDFRNEMAIAVDEFTDLIDKGTREIITADRKRDGTALSIFQRHVREDMATERHRTPDDDDSIDIAICHSTMRQMEALRDYIYDDLQRHPQRTLSDIAVLAPDIDEIAPYIEAVFGDIPHRIAGMSAKADTPVKLAFNTLVDIPGSRWEMSSILELLDCHQVRRALGLSQSEAGIIADWIKDSGIRWGRDSKHRHEKGLPAFEQNSWEWGTDRLLMGFATEQEEFMGGILPYIELDPAQQNALNGLFIVYDAIKQIDKKAERSPKGWADLLRALVQDLFTGDRPWENEDADTRDIEDILGALDQLEDASKYYTGEIPFSIVREYLMLGERRRGGFLPGRLLFAPLLNMRGLKYDVIALVEMGDNYPGKERISPFNLISEKPLPGERNMRNEAKALFLDTLMSARDRLYISYTGKSSKTNKPKAPSVFLQSLMDSLEGLFGTCESDGGKGQLPFVKHHRLQAFDPAYFSGGELFTYTKRKTGEADIAVAKKIFYEGPYKHQKLEITPQQFVSFWKNPPKFFCNNVLEIKTPYDEKVIDDTEPLGLDHLEKWGLGNEIISGRTLNEGLIKGRGILPVDPLGKGIFNEVEQNAQLVLDQLEGTFFRDFPINIDTEQFSISGTLTLRTDTQPTKTIYIAHYSEMSEKYILGGAMIHLMMNSQHGRYNTKIIFRDGNFTLNQDFDDLTLNVYLEVFRDGLTGPLPFHPELSHTYCSDYKKAIQNELTHDSASTEAFDKVIWTKTAWEHNKNIDDYYILSFGETKPRDKKFRGEFHDTAIEVWNPIDRMKEKE